MTYTIEFKNSAAKALRKLPKAAQKRIVDRLTEFESSLPPAEETKMKGQNIVGINKNCFVHRFGVPYK